MPQGGCQNASVTFTTHIYELAELIETGRYSGARNLKAEIIEGENGAMIRTYKVIPGKAESSQGEEVANKVGITDANINYLLDERARRGEFSAELLRKI